MSKVKRPHTVQRAYLKNFTSDGKSFFFFDKVLNRTGTIATRDATVSGYFYDIPKEGLSEVV